MKEQKEKDKANSKKKESYAMIVAWGSRSKESDGKIDETTYMPLEDQDLEEEQEEGSKYKVSLLDLKDKLYFFSKKILISLTNYLTDDIHDLKTNKDQLLSALESLK